MDRKMAQALLQNFKMIEAFAEGKKIEYWSDGVWIVYELLDFSHTPDRYRIKPEPKVIYVNEYGKHGVVAHATKQEAENSFQKYHQDGTPRCAVKYIEVIDKETK